MGAAIPLQDVIMGLLFAVPFLAVLLAIVAQFTNGPLGPWLRAVWTARANLRVSEQQVVELQGEVAALQAKLAAAQAGRAELLQQVQELTAQLAPLEEAKAQRAKEKVAVKELQERIRRLLLLAQDALDGAPLDPKVLDGVRPLPPSTWEAMRHLRGSTTPYPIPYLMPKH